MGSNGLELSQMGSNGLKWAQVVSNGLKWAQMGSNGLNWAHIGSNAFKRVQKGSNGLKCVQLGSNATKRAQLEKFCKIFNIHGIFRFCSHCTFNWGIFSRLFVFTLCRFLNHCQSLLWVHFIHTCYTGYRTSPS